MTGADGQVWPWEWPDAYHALTITGGDGRFRPMYYALRTTEAMLSGRVAWRVVSIAARVDGHRVVASLAIAAIGRAWSFRRWADGGRGSAGRVVVSPRSAGSLCRAAPRRRHHRLVERPPLAGTPPPRCGGPHKREFRGDHAPCYRLVVVARQLASESDFAGWNASGARDRCGHWTYIPSWGLHGSTRSVESVISTFGIMCVWCAPAMAVVALGAVRRPRLWLAFGPILLAVAVEAVVYGRACRGPRSLSPAVSCTPPFCPGSPASDVPPHRGGAVACLLVWACVNSVLSAGTANAWVQWTHVYQRGLAEIEHIPGP